MKFSEKTFTILINVIIVLIKIDSFFLKSYYYIYIFSLHEHGTFLN